MFLDRDVILFIAMSLDGYIAGPDDNLDFLEIVEEQGQDYGYRNFMNGIDTVIMGRRTYEKVISMGVAFPHSDLATYVITHKSRPDSGNVKFYTGNLKELLQKLKSQKGKDIFVDGGAILVNDLLKENLIDNFYISIIPVLLGGGIRLFHDGRSPMSLKLAGCTSYSKGLVQLHYVRS